MAKKVKVPPILEPVKKSSQVNNPSHYGGSKNPYETIKVIEAWDLDFCLGNAIKYISRAAHKDNMVQDLEKAIWYIQRKLSQIKEAQNS